MHTDVRQHPLGFWEAIDKPSREALQAFYADRYYQTGHGFYRPDYPPDERRYIEAKIRQKSEQISAIRGDTARAHAGCGLRGRFRSRVLSPQRLAGRGNRLYRDGHRRDDPACRDAVTTGDMMELLADRVREQRQYDLIWMTNVLDTWSIH